MSEKFGLPESTNNTSCYSCVCPPEIGTLVVVCVDRVDDHGIWGSLVDWGDKCTAYLPMGSIGKEKGRGERKAQLHFLTLARRSTKRNQHQMMFSAFIQTAEPSSSRGVADCPDGDIGEAQFHCVVSRRGVDDDMERGAIELSRTTRLCAHKLVDNAASMSKMSTTWARKATMHAAYERALLALGKEDSDEGCRPEEAPVQFLLHTIGNIEREDVNAVLNLLPVNPNDNVPEEQMRFFASTLLSLCRDEKLRRSKPVGHHLKVGFDEVMKEALKTESPFTFDIKHLTAAFESTRSVAPPSGCSTASVTIKGRGKFILSTAAPADLDSTAMNYLNSIKESAQKTWLELAPSAEEIYSKSADEEITPKAKSDLQPTLSIGVIGDVANGKSTLVKAISGKRTQSHSSEQQQHGITIRLGFANAAVIKCQNDDCVCGMFSFLPESEDHGKQPTPNCPKCNFETQVVKRFSLVDCPGHAELMATMLAGSSAFDACILAAASNLPCPTPQARQHLEAIKMSGIMDVEQNRQNAQIAIAQTKAELLADDSKNSTSRFTSEERLKNHADQARHNLKHTVAREAPIFPTCSPMGLGLDVLAEWIASLPSTSNKQNACCGPHLTVLRSFDVNRPGQPVEKLKGGVLGGTIQGAGSISIGSILEVRPGVVLPCSSNSTKAKPKTDSKKPTPDFKIQPLRFQCTSLMSGKNKLSSASKGGLVAVGTTIDPLLLADNRMVGNIAGPPGSLPPVWGPTLFMDNLQPVDVKLPENGAKTSDSQKPSHLVKKGCEIRAHIGSATVKGHVVRVSKSRGKLEVCLESPVCAARGASVALEGKGAAGFCLVAHAKLADGDVCIEGVDTTCNVSADGGNNSVEAEDLKMAGKGTNGGDSDLLENDRCNRQRFLDDLASCKELKDSDGSRLAVPLPDIARDGGAHVVVSNFGLIAHALRRDAAHVVLYLQKEGGLSCVLAGSKASPATTTLRVKWRGGRGFPNRFVSILKKYIRAYVTCNQCRSAVTELLGISNTEQACRHCNARRYVPKL